MFNPIPSAIRAWRLTFNRLWHRVPDQLHIQHWCHFFYLLNIMNLDLSEDPHGQPMHRSYQMMVVPVIVKGRIRRQASKFNNINPKLFRPITSKDFEILFNFFMPCDFLFLLFTLRLKPLRSPLTWPSFCGCKMSWTWATVFVALKDPQGSFNPL